MSFKCSLSPLDLLIATMTAADATAYVMPMMASCGMCASWPLIIEKIASQVAGKVVTLAPSVGGEKPATDYIQLFEYNVNTLAAALKQVTGK